MNATRALRDPSPHHRHRLVIWLGVFTLFLSLMSPLIAIQTADAQERLQRLQGETQECPPGQVMDEAGTCIDDPAQSQNEALDQTQDPAEGCPEGQIPDGQGGCMPDQVQPPPTDPTYIQLDKYDCPPDTDWSTVTDLAALSQGCAPNQATVNMTVNGATQAITASGEWGPYQDVASYLISEQIPTGYNLPHWFCGVYIPNVSQPTMNYFGASDQVAPTVAPGESLYCQVFNHQSPSGGTVTVYKWNCMTGTEAGRELDYYQGSLPDQETGPCETEHLNVPISLIDGNGAHPTTTQANGTQWEDVVLENGSFQIAIDEPDGYGEPMVFCGTLDQDTPSAVSATGGTITLTPTATPFDYQCNWYNIPLAGAQIVVEKYWCPPGLAFVQTPTQADMQAACQETGSGASFELSGPAGAEQMWDVKAPEGGPPQSVFWDQLPAGDYTIREMGLDDTWTYTVFCHESSGLPNGVAPAMQQMVDGNGVTWTAQPGYTFACAWFNQPADGGVTTTDTGNSITVYKWQCVEGTEYGNAHAYYQGENGYPGPCEQEHLNIPIRLIDGSPDSPHETTTQANGTQFDNVVLQNGSFQIAIDEPDGYGEPMVFCGTLDDEAQTAVPTTDGMWTITPSSEPFTYQCNVYDILAGDNSVTVYKWDCEPGTMSGEPHAYYQGEGQDTGPCETVHGGIPIRLYDDRPDSPHEDVTSHNTPDWDGVVLDQNGSFQIEVDEPAGYGDPMVFCSTLDEEQRTMVDATGGMATITPASEPFDYQCDWYNIPYEGEYQLDLFKFTCTDDVDRNLGLPDLGTDPSCAPDQGVSFTATFGMTPGSARYTDPNGQLSWLNPPAGPWSLSEMPMAGYQPSKVFCGPSETTEAPEVPVMDWTVTGTLDSTNPHVVCTWFNFEQPHENGRIIIFKYQCPPGTESTDFGLLQETCTTPHNGIGFTLTGSGVESSASTSSGSVSWLDLAQGTYTVTEDLWPGYNVPLVWCGYVMQDGADIDPVSQEFTSYPVTDTSIQLELSNFPAHIVCYWYNFPTDPGEITIHKWTCPPGYDIDAWGADPKTDCTAATNGVTFTLDQPVGTDLQTDTGDAIDGAVSFGGLDPGTYTVTETVPAGTAYVFVLDCTGTDIPKVHQIPLSWGNRLDVNVSSGDQIVCNWYNVPRLETGWVTVYKYVCSTTTFVDKVYCVTYEQGRAFELFRVDGSVSMGTGITGAGGTYTWSDLEPGAHSIREEGGVPCKMTASNVDGKGNAWVNAGEGTLITVYNCTTSPGKVPPGKVPTKYPNTGVPLGGIVAPSLQNAPEGTATPGTDEESETFYQVDCLSGDAAAATPPPSTPISETEATMPPIEAEPTETPPPAESEGTPTPPATPDVGEGECERGAIPRHLEIESVGIDADFEYLEIVDGLMQQPSGPELVAWYKDTARLGETNNVVVAGHLNWWNVPEGVFYRLQDLEEGDRVEVTGDDGRVYVYEVQWVRQESNLEPPGVDVIGPTDEPTLTLITCGGEWNADIAEYEERTVARAVQVDVLEAEESAGSAPGVALAA